MSVTYTQERRQGVCLWGGGGAKCLPTAARTYILRQPWKRRSAGRGGGGGGGGDSDTFFSPDFKKISK